jgi:hypothetical protein
MLRVLRLFAVAVGINFIWEMAQMPLYQGMPFDELSSWWLCLRASVGDGVIVVAIWAIGSALFRRFEWYAPLRPAPIAALLITGALIAVGIEIHALGTGRWAYSQLMPTVPLLGVGLSPLVQLLVLPYLSMKLGLG